MMESAFRSEAVHQALRVLAAQSSRCDPEARHGDLSLSWALRLAEAAATYIALFAEHVEANAGEVDFESVLDEAIRLWTLDGWRLEIDDQLTGVIVAIAEEAVGLAAGENMAVN